MPSTQSEPSRGPSSVLDLAAQLVSEADELVESINHPTITEVAEALVKTAQDNADTSGPPSKPCPHCHGRGRVRRSMKQKPMWWEVQEHRCSHCRGVGRVLVENGEQR